MSDEKPQEQKTQTLIEQTIATVERLEKAKQEAKVEADRLEQLKSDAMLSGTAGIRPIDNTPQKTPKEKAKEYSKLIMAGKKPE